MKTYLLIILTLMMSLMFGCTYKFDIKESDSLKKLNKVEYPTNEYNPTCIDNKMVDTLNLFTLKTSKQFFDKETNNIYSPISLYTCLALLAEGAEETSFDELMSFLETDDLQILKQNVKTIYLNNYYKNDKGQAKMANSVWIKKSLPVKQDYINTLTNDYFTEAYNVIFDKTTNQNVVDWINYQTNDLLDLTVDKYTLNSDLQMLLLNTIYFDNKWATEFNKDQTKEDTFYGKQEMKADFMTHQVSSKYYESDKYIYVEDYFYNDNTISYILPNEGVDVYSLLDENLFKNKQLQSCNARITVPKFKYFSNYLLVDGMKELGVNEIFNGTLAKLTKIVQLQTENLYVSSVKQNAGIELNEDGVKAAAVTSIDMACTSIDPDEIINVNLNRPFIYIIKDSNNIPLFIGVLMNPNK